MVKTKPPAGWTPGPIYSMPTVTSNIPKDLRVFVDRVREVVTGGGVDSLVSVRQLIAAGVVTHTGTKVISTANTTVVVPPTTPLNVSASGALANIMVTWDKPSYSGHAYAEVWAAARTSAQEAASPPEDPTLGQAVLVGMAPGVFFAHSLGAAADRWYWVRFVNTLGEVGPYQSTEGVAGATSVDPAYMLEVLTGAITDSQLYSSLSTRIDLIDADDTVVGSVAYQVGQEALARASADGINSTSINSLDTRLASAEGTVTSQGTSINSLTSSLSTANTNISGNATAISGLGTRVTTAEGSITSQASDITALENTVNNGTTGVSANATALSSLNTTVTNQGSDITSQASDITTLQTTTGTNTTSIQTNATSISGLDAQYTVKIDSNGAVAGFGLASTTTGSGNITSEFIVNADRFALMRGGSNTTAASVPFAVQASSTTLNGETVPAGVYMAEAFIKNGAISNVKIGDAAIDSAKIATAAIQTAHIDDAQITSAKIGNAEITNANIASGTITSANIQNGTIDTADIASAAITLALIDTATITNLSSVSADMGTITAGELKSSDNKFVIDLNNKTISIET